MIADLGPHSRAVIHRDLGTSFALPALALYDAFCAGGDGAAAEGICGEDYMKTAATDAPPTCPRFLAAPVDDGAGGAASLHCFVQPTCGACVATDPAKSLCGWCAEYSACVHHYHVNCPPAPGAVINATGCAAGAAPPPPADLQAAPVPRRDCPAGYVGCTDSHGSTRCAPCAAQCWEFLDPTSPREHRLADLMARLTVSEKISLLNNDAPGIPRLNLQPYTTSECLHGYATTASANGSAIISTQFPTPLNLGASFNTSLVEAIGRAIGYEARAHENYWNAQGYRGPGVQCLSPNANIARSPLWGRTQEVCFRSILSFWAHFCDSVCGQIRCTPRIRLTPLRWLGDMSEVCRGVGSTRGSCWLGRSRSTG